MAQRNIENCDRTVTELDGISNIRSLSYKFYIWTQLVELWNIKYNTMYSGGFQLVLLNSNSFWMCTVPCTMQHCSQNKMCIKFSDAKTSESGTKYDSGILFKAISMKFILCPWRTINKGRIFHKKSLLMTKWVRNLTWIPLKLNIEILQIHNWFLGIYNLCCTDFWVDGILGIRWFSQWLNSIMIVRRFWWNYKHYPIAFHSVFKIRMMPL